MFWNSNKSPNKLKAKFLWLQNWFWTFSSPEGELRLHHTATDWIVEKVCDKAQLYYAFSYLLSIAYQWMGKEVVVE